MADVKARLLTLLFSIIMSLNVIHPKALNVPWELLEKMEEESSFYYRQHTYKKFFMISTLKTKVWTQYT